MSSPIQVSIAHAIAAFFGLGVTIVLVLLACYYICNWYYYQVYRRFWCDAIMEQIKYTFRREGVHYPHRKRAIDNVMSKKGDYSALHDLRSNGDDESKFTLTDILLAKINNAMARGGDGGDGGGGDELDVEKGYGGKEKSLLEIVKCGKCDKKLDGDGNGSWIVVTDCLHVRHKECASERCCLRPEAEDFKFIEVSIAVKPLNERT